MTIKDKMKKNLNLCKTKGHPTGKMYRNLSGWKNRKMSM